MTHARVALSAAARFKCMTGKRSCLLSRRAFLNGAIGASFASTNWDKAMSETPVAQVVHKRLIVDAQVHVWKAEFVGLAVDPRIKTANARAVHHREAATVDG